MYEPTLHRKVCQYNSCTFEKHIKNMQYSLSFRTSSVYIFYNDKKEHLYEYKNTN